MRKFALLVGVEDYRDKMISRLQFACADATAVAERLRDRCGFDQVRVLADKSGDNEPLLVNIVTALRDTAAELRPEDLFLFFFAGHGIEKDGHGYLLARDSLQAFPEHGSLSLELLRKTFERLNAGKRIILLDACRNSPDAGRSDAANCMGDLISRDIVAAARSRLTGGTTTALLSACRAGQRAYEWPARRHGVFTQCLIEGLDGAAWTGGQLEFSRLASHTAKEVRQWSANMPGLPMRQEPWYEQFGDTEPILLASDRFGVELAVVAPMSPSPGEIGAQTSGISATPTRHSLPPELLTARRAVHLRRFDRILPLAKEVQVSIGHVKADVELVVLATWLRQRANELVAAPRWYGLGALGTTDDRLSVHLDHVPQSGASLIPNRNWADELPDVGTSDMDRQDRAEHFHRLLEGAYSRGILLKSKAQAAHWLAAASKVASSAASLAWVALAYAELLQDFNTARSLWRTSQDAAAGSDLGSVATVGLQLGLLCYDDARAFLLRQERAASSVPELHICAFAWLELFVDSEAFKRCAIQAMKMARRGISDEMILEWLAAGCVDIDEDAQLAQDLLIKAEAGVLLEKFIPGHRAAENAWAWISVLKNPSRAAQVLVSVEDELETSLDCVSIARVWRRIGDARKSVEALARAGRLAKDDEDRRAVKDAAVEWGPPLDPNSFMAKRKAWF